MWLLCNEQYLGLTVTYLVKQMRTHDSDIEINIQHEDCRITNLIKNAIDKLISRVAGLDLWDLVRGDPVIRVYGWGV